MDLNQKQASADGANYVERAFQILNEKYIKQVEEIKQLREQIVGLQESLEDARSDNSVKNVKITFLTEEVQRRTKECQDSEEILQMQLKMQENVITRQVSELEKSAEKLKAAEQEIAGKGNGASVCKMEELEDLKRELTKEKKLRTELELKCKLMEKQLSRFTGNLKMMVQEAESGSQEQLNVAKQMEVDATPDIFISKTIFSPGLDAQTPTTNSISSSYWDLKVATTPKIPTFQRISSPTPGDVPPPMEASMPESGSCNDAAYTQPQVSTIQKLEAKRRLLSTQPKAVSFDDLSTVSPRTNRPMPLSEKIKRMSIESSQEKVKAPLSKVPRLVMATQPPSSPVTISCQPHVISSSFVMSGPAPLGTKEHKPDALKETHLLAYYCVCGVEFGSRNNLAAHVKYFANRSKFQCEYCEEGFDTVYIMNEHCTQRHSEKELKTKLAPGCRDCGVIFANVDEFNGHRVLEESTKMLHCPVKIMAVGNSRNRRF